MNERQTTFKDLPFLVKHFGGINALYEFKNGWKISVSAGEFPYSYPRENFGNPEGYSSFEVAVIYSFPLSNLLLLVGIVGVPVN